MGVVLIQPQMRPAVDTFRGLWSEVTEGTFVYRDPTDAEKAAARKRRAKLFADSRVPWIMSDVGALTQAYDDVQDVVAFSRWNKTLLLKGAIPKCVRDCVKAGGRSPKDCFFRCICPGGRPAKRHAKHAMRGWGTWAEGIGLAMARFAPGMRQLPYLLLAGQVAYSFFGVGLRLGPLFGAAYEYAFRGLEAVGLPFGPEHNKYHQLKRARVLQQSDKIFGASGQLDPEDQLTTYAGLADGFRLIGEVPQVVWNPKDYPSTSDLMGKVLNAVGRGDVPYLTSPTGMLEDVYDVGKGLFELGASMPGNILSYLAHDLLEPMQDRIFGQPPPGEVLGPQAPTPEQKAMLRLTHVSECPGPGCAGVVDDAMSVAEWAEGSDSTGGSAAKFPPLLSRLYGGALSTGAL